MALPATCPVCQSPLTIPEERREEQVRCQVCGATCTAADFPEGTAPPPSLPDSVPVSIPCSAQLPDSVPVSIPCSAQPGENVLSQKFQDAMRDQANRVWGGVASRCPLGAALAR